MTPNDEKKAYSAPQVEDLGKLSEVTLGDAANSAPDLVASST